MPALPTAGDGFRRKFQLEEEIFLGKGRGEALAAAHRLAAEQAAQREFARLAVGRADDDFRLGLLAGEATRRLA